MPNTIAAHSLSARMLWLTTGIVLATAALAFLPGLANERQRWLADRFTQANMAILLASAVKDGELDPEMRDALLHRAGVMDIQLIDGGKRLLSIGAAIQAASPTKIDLRRESWIGGARQALGALAADPDHLLLVSDQSPFTVGTELELAVPAQGLKQALWRFSTNYSLISLMIAGINGAIVYFALVLFLVTPMRRITRSIMAFRSDPERFTPLDPTGVTLLPDDEMALASREIAAMQSALRTVLGRNARLVAVGTSVAKTGHDLRNALAPALLMSENLSRNPDPAIRHAGEAIMAAVNRANDLVRQTLKFVREGPAPLAAECFALVPMMAEAVEAAGIAAICDVRLEIGRDQRVDADPEQILRVLLNLFRNAGEAGARHITVRAAAGQPPGLVSTGLVAIDIADAGPGIPETVRESLFQPFTRSTKPGGSGLGLAISRDLLRANHGDLLQVSTGPGGTVFRLLLPAAAPADADIALEHDRR